MRRLARFTLAVLVEAAKRFPLFPWSTLGGPS